MTVFVSHLFWNSYWMMSDSSLWRRLRPSVVLTWQLQDSIQGIRYLKTRFLLSLSCETSSRDCRVKHPVFHCQGRNWWPLIFFDIDLLLAYSLSRGILYLIAILVFVTKGFALPFHSFSFWCWSSSRVCQWLLFLEVALLLHSISLVSSWTLYNSSMRNLLFSSKSISSHTLTLFISILCSSLRFPTNLKIGERIWFPIVDFGWICLFNEGFPGRSKQTLLQHIQD